MSRRRLASGLIRIPLLAIRLLGTGGESSGPMKTRGAIATPRNSRLEITKQPQLFRLRDEPLLIRVNAQLGYRRRRAEGADRNTTLHPRINRSPITLPPPRSRLARRFDDDQTRRLINEALERERVLPEDGMTIWNGRYAAPKKQPHAQ